MKVRYTRRALSDQAEIYRYLFDRTPAGARRVLESIDAAIELVADIPHAGASAGANLRVVSVRGYPYRVFYRVTRDAVQIIHIRHTARQPFTGLNEPPQASFASAQG